MMEGLNSLLLGSGFLSLTSPGRSSSLRTRDHGKSQLVALIIVHGLGLVDIEHTLGGVTIGKGRESRIAVLRRRWRRRGARERKQQQGVAATVEIRRDREDQ